MDKAHYSRSVSAFQEKIPKHADKKVKRTRAKSAARDAQFRPLFQALDALDGVARSGRTSVTYAAPNHPLFPIIKLDASSTTFTPAPYEPEDLDNDEEIRLHRHWQNLLTSPPRNHRKPAAWRDLSDEARLEWFHHALRSIGPASAFTLNLSPAVEEQVRREPSSAGWLSKRIARRLKQALGRAVPLWFAFELEGGRLHLHGELGASVAELPAVRKALRLAGGEWLTVRQHQAHTVSAPTLPWVGYAAKEAWRVRPFTGRLAGIARPINGDWYFATNRARSTANKLYDTQKEAVTILL